MPLVEHSTLPTFDKLRREGQTVLTPDEARHQELPAVHVGLLNMMPDAAFQVTERQFMRLVGSATQRAAYFVHCVTVEGLPRGEPTQAYIARHYTDLPTLQNDDIHALIVTGTNVANPRLDVEPFYRPLTDVIGWATENVSSVLCSCLATHALMKFLHGADRTPLPRKQWGVYRHRVGGSDHPLLRGLGPYVDVPHSRYNTITRQQFEDAGFTILIESDEAGVHAAVSDDQFRRVYFQGHPEYDVNSLLKEYRREVLRYFDGSRDLPPFPDHYIPEGAALVIGEYLEAAHRAHGNHNPLPEFPEGEVLPHLANTWATGARAIFDNWLALVCQLTHGPGWTTKATQIGPRRPVDHRTGDSRTQDLSRSE